MSAPSRFSALAPLRLPVFRMLWFASVMANVTMWMNDVAAAWTMTTMTTSPLWVALVQTASTAPVFLLGLPSGAMADTLDRKKFFLFTQLWVTLVALVLSSVVFMQGLSPLLLLLLTFANGIGMAMRWPVLAAVIPEVVPRAELPNALGLNSMSMNASRIAGPIVAGALIAQAGSAWVFLLNAVLSICTVVIIARWQREHHPSPLGREPLLTAMRVGLQYVAQSRGLKSVLLFSALTFFHLTGLTALLPLVAHGLHGDAGTFTLLLSTMGAGAVSATFVVPHLRHRVTRDALILRASLLLSAATAAIAWTDEIWVAVVAMYLFGAAWFTQANVLSVAAQTYLPDWVRARGMALFQMSVMGAGAAGAAVWGQMASHSSVPHSLLFAAACGAASMAVALQLRPDTGHIDDLTPHRELTPPQTGTPPPPGRVLVEIEFLIDPARTDEFRTLMCEESRASRLRLGALSWELLEDLGSPGRFLEVFEESSWTDHLRRYDRITAADVALRERRQAFHQSSKPPKVTRFLMESTVRRDA